MDKKSYSALEVEMVRIATKLEGHENVCSERYKRIDETLLDHNSQFKNIFTTVLAASGTVIITLGSAIGYLVYHVK